MEIPVIHDFPGAAGKIVLVTGGSRGIGRGIALRFAEAGAEVALTYTSSRKEAEGAVKEAGKRGRNSRAYQWDAALSYGAGELVEAVTRDFGGIDILINNAGIYPTSPLVDISAEEWDRMLDVNVRGVHLLTQAVAGWMAREQSGGAVVNIASIEGLDPAPNHAHYAASKGGVIMYTRACALELAEHGIRVNAVSPGLIRQEGIEESWPDGVERYLKAAPLKRLGMPEDVADACLFLASDLARWITGINLVVDGGLSATPRY